MVPVQMQNIINYVKSRVVRAVYFSLQLALAPESDKVRARIILWPRPKSSKGKDAFLLGDAQLAQPAGSHPSGRTPLSLRHREQQWPPGRPSAPGCRTRLVTTPMPASLPGARPCMPAAGRLARRAVGALRELDCRLQRVPVWQGGERPALLAGNQGVCFTARQQGG